MNITQRLLETDPTLELHNEGDWSHPYNPNVKGFTSFNDAGVETEVGEFLYSMVRILKPQHVLETGTHIGAGGMAYMGTALKDNGFGILETVEFIQEIHERALQRAKDLEIIEHVILYKGDVKDWISTSPNKYKLILLDTEPQTRFAELIKFYDYLEDGGYIFIHDLHQHMHQVPNEEHGFAWPFGVIPLQIRAMVESGKLRPFHFETPRGLTGFYKPDEKDFKWI